jgi:hypothetical protein
MCIGYVSTFSTNLSTLVRFQVLRAGSMKMIAFWDIAPYSLVEVGRRFRGAFCLHHQRALMMEVVHISETSVYINETTRRYIFQKALIFTTTRKHVA